MLLFYSIKNPFKQLLGLFPAVNPVNRSFSMPTWDNVQRGDSPGAMAMKRSGGWRRGDWKLVCVYTCVWANFLDAGLPSPYEWKPAQRLAGCVHRELLHAPLHSCETSFSSPSDRETNTICFKHWIHHSVKGLSRRSFEPRLHSI